MSKITMKYSGKEYALEYNRKSVRMMESQGFAAEELTKQPVTMIPLLFQGAFLKNHKGIKRDLIDEIYDGVADKSALIGALVELYTETLNTLIGDREDEGNVSWAVSK